LDWQDAIAQKLRGEAQRNVPLAARTSVRVGGAAELFVRPADTDDLVTLLALARELHQPLHVLGGGANTLVGDLGIPGITLKLREEDERIEDRGDTLMLELSAGAPSGRIVQLAKEHGLLGVEWAAGIPGTVGGMTAMNAGTRVGEMKDNLVEALLVTADGARWVPAAQLEFAYRHSNLHGAVVAKVRLVLRKGDAAQVAASLEAMEKDRSYRKNSQPLNLPNSGSVFRNPPGNAAGRLIESVGLKGHREGGAQISEVHANFIVNRGGATAKDVTTLMALAQQRVRERHQISLALEVRLVGLFAPTPEHLGLEFERVPTAG
jgi:UDP-N-acetylmuramate dehydrogenase